MVSLDDYNFLDSFKGKRIKLTTKYATFTGVVQRINLDKTIILADVEVNDDTKLHGTKLFFGHEILNIEFPSVPSENKYTTGIIEEQKLGQLTTAEFQPYRSKFLLDDDDTDGNYVSYVVIDEFHERFGPAVMHIREQKVIGIGVDGVGAFQHKRLCWLQIATKNNVYLFDILMLGARAFKNGLSNILENSHILKVAHDCRHIAGCLMTQYRVNLANVFDTQVADVLHFHTETGGFLPDRVSMLQEAVSLHLKMPLNRLSSLRIKAQLSQEDKEVWYVRPCPAPLLKLMALSVIHLQTLRLVLLDALMFDYTSLVDSYLSSGHDEHLNTHHIGRSGLELPKELRELETIRYERQKWAVKNYPVTENGLLKRYNVKPLSESDKPNLKRPGPQEPCGFEPSLLERGFQDPAPSPDHLKKAATSAENATDFKEFGQVTPPDKMITPNTTGVDSYLCSGQDEPMNTQPIRWRGLELPKELRGRETIKCEHQKWAVNHYSVTEDVILKHCNVNLSSESDRPNLKHPGTEEPCSSGQSLLEGRSQEQAPFPDHLNRAPTSAEKLDLKESWQGLPQDKVITPNTTAFFGLGRGQMVSSAAMALREHKHKHIDEKNSSIVTEFRSSEPVSEPFTIMGGVAMKKDCPATVPYMGRAIYQTPACLTSSLSLSFSSFRKAS